MILLQLRVCLDQLCLVLSQPCPVVLALLSFALELVEHGAAGTRIAHGMLRLFLAILTTRAKMYEHHMPNKVSCLLLSAGVVWCLSQSTMLTLLACMEPTFGRNSIITFSMEILNVSQMIESIFIIL